MPRSKPTSTCTPHHFSTSPSTFLLVLAIFLCFTLYLGLHTCTLWQLNPKMYNHMQITHYSAQDNVRIDSNAVKRMVIFLSPNVFLQCWLDLTWPQASSLGDPACISCFYLQLSLSLLLLLTTSTDINASTSWLSHLQHAYLPMKSWSWHKVLVL